MCGAGVAGKLAQALTGEEGLHRVIDLVALATVADLVPLIEENRILVYEGLKGMDNSTREGIKALKEVAGIKEGPIKASQVAFTLAPRLNAAGRLSDASQGVELLLTKDREKARKIAENLQEENELRRKIEGDLLEKAKEQITNTMDLSTRRTIVVVGEEWNSGVIGLVASRIVEEHHYPTVVLSKQENQYVGSGRSISGVNLYKGLKACEKHFTRFGGHEQAAGLTIPAENVEAFIEDFDKAIKKENSAEAFIPTKEYDMTLSLPLVTQELVEKLEKLQPTGFGNPEPVFLLDQVEVSGVRAIGKEKDHMKLIFTQGNTVKEGIAFRMAQLAPSLTDKAKVLFVPDINHFQGVTKTQCLVKAIAPLYEKIPESFLEPFSFEKARIEDLLWGLSKDSRTAVANIPPLALEGEDDLTKLLKGSQGTLLLARTRTEGVKVFALVKEKVDLSLNIVEGSKGYHTLLIAPQLKNLKNHWENIVFLDGAFEDEVGLVQKQCPKAQIWLGNPKKEVKQTISSLALTDESLRELYRLMRKKVFFTLEDLAKERNLTKGQTLVGLWVFKQMDLINFELQPFSYTILPPTPCNIGDAPLLKSLREKN